MKKKIKNEIKYILLLVSVNKLSLINNDIKSQELLDKPHELLNDHDPLGVHLIAIGLVTLIKDNGSCESS